MQQADVRFIFDFARPDSWPVAVTALLEENAEKIEAELRADLLAHESDKYILDPVAQPTYDFTKDQLEKLLRGFRTRAFHCTRLADPDAVQRTGLSPLLPEKIEATVLAELERCGVNAVDLERASTAFAKFRSNRGYAGREGFVWFVLTQAMTNDSGCKEFFQSFGGEVARRAFSAYCPDLLPQLRNVGHPVVVEAVLELSKAQGYQLSNMAEQLIGHGIRKVLKRRQRPMECEMAITTQVLPENIHSILMKRIKRS